MLVARAQQGTTHADAGASSVEYGLIVFAIAATMVFALFALGPPVRGMFEGTCTVMKTSVEGSQQDCP